ncbi:MAG: elongation factor G, partial [Oscillospiraceae bacterium]|nr:elongation factor G [Oscillospiraceae bacterium]
MAQYTAENIRNIALAGHGSAGKTSLAEALLFKAGATDRLGKVLESNTVCDFDPEEIKRQVSVSLAVAPLTWKNTKINVLDTPGLFDFAAGMYEGVRAANNVLIALSGKSGVSVGTEKAYRMAKQAKKPAMFCVTKLDLDNADFYKVLEQLKTVFGPSVCPVIVPIYESHDVVGYINLIDMKAFAYDTKGNAKEVHMPGTGHRVEGLIAAISEAVAETDEELFEKYFSGEQFTKEEIMGGIKKGVKDGSITPVVCCSSFTLAGVDMVLDMICELMPSPAEAKDEELTDMNGEPVEIVCADNEPLAAFVFKTIADPFVGKISLLKVISGKLTVGMELLNTRADKAEKMGTMFFLRGKTQGEVAPVVAGDIVAASKLQYTQTGDTLCDKANYIQYPKVA